MYLKSGEIKGKDLQMIAKDYYERFEKINLNQSAFRNKSIQKLQEGKESSFLKKVDSNYVLTLDFLNEIDFFDAMVSLKNGTYTLAYAIIGAHSFREDKIVYSVKDIIIHDEEHLEDLAEGEISIRKNIYRIIVDFIQDTLKFENEFVIEFRMIDSADLCELLYERGYTFDNETTEKPLHKLIRNGNLIMSKEFSLIKDDEDELRLTRKQN